MAQWQTVLERIAGEVRAHSRSLRRTAADPAGGCGSIQVVPYRGYGTPTRLHVLGRVVEDEALGPAAPGDSRWRNLLHTLRRIESDEVPGALVRVAAGGAEVVASSDMEGYVRATLVPPAPVPPDRSWHQVTLELQSHEHRRGDCSRAVARVLVPPASARYGVISDIDDTVVQTDVGNLVRLARTVLFTNAHTRVPFPGVSAFYHALVAGATGHDGNPVFYVSHSPWNLYDLIAEFLEVQRIPEGPLLLRDWGRRGRTTLGRGQDRHKLELIDEIMGHYPHLPFILIGDSGQQDPEIYREIVQRHPRRVLAIYIRNVSRSTSRSSAITALADEVVHAGSALILADDTGAAARHAAEHGWIAAEALAEIEAACEEDEALAEREGVQERAVTIEVGPDADRAP